METVEEIIGLLKKEFGQDFRQDTKDQWRFEIYTESGRSQVVTMKFKINNHSNKDLSRYVCYSPIGPIFTGINLDFILRYNYTVDIGAIAIDDLENTEGIKVPYLVFKASHLAVTADYQEIWELIVKTGNYADKLEHEIFAKDLH